MSSEGAQECQLIYTLVEPVMGIAVDDVDDLRDHCNYGQMKTGDGFVNFNPYVRPVKGSTNLLVHIYSSWMPFYFGITRNIQQAMAQGIRKNL